MLLIMIRHAQSDANAAGRLSGQIDSELSAVGRAQAAALAQRMAKEPLSRVYSSDLKRAADTADALCAAQAGPLEPQLCQWLRERDAGVLQGLTKQQRKSRHPELHRAWKSDDPDLPIDSGESRREFEARVVGGIKALAGEYGDQTVAVVAHAGVLQAMFNFVFDSRQNGNQLRCANTAICRFRYELEVWSMECWGDSAHL